MNSYYLFILFAIVVGWCLHLIWEDLTKKPWKTPLFKNEPAITVSNNTGGPVQAYSVAGTLQAAILALNLMGVWLEELQIENPLLPEECLTAQQWIAAALDQVEAKIRSGEINN